MKNSAGLPILCFTTTESFDSGYYEEFKCILDTSDNSEDSKDNFETLKRIGYDVVKATTTPVLIKIPQQIKDLWLVGKYSCGIFGTIIDERESK